MPMTMTARKHRTETRPRTLPGKMGRQTRTCRRTSQEMYHGESLRQVPESPIPGKEGIRVQIGDWDIGRQRGGELAPKVAPRRLVVLTPKLRIFCRISTERGHLEGPPKIENSRPPSNFRRFDPPYPGLQPKILSFRIR